MYAYICVEVNKLVQVAQPCKEWLSLYKCLNKQHVVVVAALIGEAYCIWIAIAAAQDVQA
jgi:hypothetical protein